MKRLFFIRVNLKTKFITSLQLFSISDLSCSIAATSAPCWSLSALAGYFLAAVTVLLSSPLTSEDSYDFGESAGLNLHCNCPLAPPSV